MTTTGDEAAAVKEYLNQNGGRDARNLPELWEVGGTAEGFGLCSPPQFVRAFFLQTLAHVRFPALRSTREGALAGVY